MERRVNVLVHRMTKDIIVNPFGTFDGYGAFVGVNPYRVLEANTESDKVGALIIELLGLSGPTGCHIRDINQQDESSLDDETERVQKKYLPHDKVSDKYMGMQFVNLTVRIKDGQKSWMIDVSKYDSKNDCLQGDRKPHKVKTLDGPGELGERIRRIANDEE